MRKVEVPAYIDECRACYYIKGEDWAYYCTHPSVGKRRIGEWLPFHKTKAIYDGDEEPVAPYRTFPNWCPLEEAD